MARLTIKLSDERQRALKETAAISGKTIGQIIEESLEAYGVKSRKQANEIVAQARRRTELDETQALALATEETKKTRRGE